MRPDSSTTRMPSSMVLKRVSRKVLSRARRCTTICKPAASRRPIRPRTLSRKLDLAGGIGLVWRKLEPFHPLEIPIGDGRGNHGDENNGVIAWLVCNFPKTHGNVFKVHSIPGPD